MLLWHVVSSWHNVKVYVLKSLRFGIAGCVLLGWAQHDVQRPDGKLQHSPKLEKFFVCEFVQRCGVPTQHDDQPSDDLAGIGVLDLPVLPDVDGRPR